MERGRARAVELDQGDSWNARFFFFHALSPLRPLRGMCLSRISSTRERVWGSICRNSVQRGYVLLCSRRVTSLVSSSAFQLPLSYARRSAPVLFCLTFNRLGGDKYRDKRLRRVFASTPAKLGERADSAPTPDCAMPAAIVVYPSGQAGTEGPETRRRVPSHGTTNTHFLYKHFSLKAQEHAQPLVLPC